MALTFGAAVPLRFREESCWPTWCCALEVAPAGCCPSLSFWVALARRRSGGGGLSDEGIDGVALTLCVLPVLLWDWYGV